MDLHDDPIEILMEEHRIIEMVVDAFQVYLKKLASGDFVEPADYGLFLRLIREFADVHHHGKEEKFLFSTMNEAGFPYDSGPLAVMLSEHTEGRRLAQSLGRYEAKAGSPSASWDQDEIAEMGELASAYRVLLFGHIQKEDRILYPMARARLAPSAYEKIRGLCRAHEDATGNASRRDELLDAADRLIQAYASTGCAPSEDGCGGCSGCG